MTVCENDDNELHSEGKKTHWCTLLLFVVCTVAVLATGFYDQDELNRKGSLLQRFKLEQY